MNLAEAIRTFIRAKKAPVHIRDLYAEFPEAHEHSIRGRIYENLGKDFQRVGRGLYVAVHGEATCVVIEGDALEEIRKLESESVDSVITDPPYPWLDHFRARATTSWKRMQAQFERREIDRDLGLELYRVLKEGAHAFIFVPAETGATRSHINRMIGVLERCGFVFRKRFIWDKCFHPETTVIYRDGTIKVGTIKDISEAVMAGRSIQVLGSSGKWVRVLRAKHTQHSGELITIRTRDGSQVRVTPDHPVQTRRGIISASEVSADDEIPALISARNKTHISKLKTLRLLGRDNSVGKLKTRSAVNAMDLSRKTGLRYNKAQWWLHNLEVPLSYPVKEHDLCAVRPLFCHRLSPLELLLDEKFGWIVGYYAAEGTTTRNTVRFAQHERELDFAGRVETWASLIGAGYQRVIRKKTKAAVANVNGQAAAVIMKYLVPGIARTKKLNEQLLDGPASFRSAMVRGWMDGDGHVEKATGRMTAVSASKMLLMQMSLLLKMERQPCIVNDYFARCQTGVFRAHRLRYTKLGHWNNVFAKREKNVAWVKVSGVSREKYKGSVYDIQVDSEDHLFCVDNGILAHNCNIGMGYSGRARHEGILFFTRGRAKRPPCDYTIPDVLSFRAIAPRQRRHPCEKPKGLLEAIIKFATKVGDIVLDAFAGSCVTGTAALGLGRNAIMIEKDGAILEKALSVEGA